MANTLSPKALKLLGETEQTVKRGFVVTSPPDKAGEGRIRTVVLEEDVAESEDNFLSRLERFTPGKAERVLGVNDRAPLEQQLTWLRQRKASAASERKVKSKALQVLGVTVQDLQVEKALIMLGEAPGREVPAGPLPRSKEEAQPLEWALPPPPPSGGSVFLLAFFPWGVLAPLNVIKLQLNKVSPGAHLWVPSETEQCQAACGVARMWATLFWSLQFCAALSCIYLHYRREVGLAIFGTANKIVVGAILLKAYFDGVIFWPIGLAGAGCEWLLALAFMRELRR